MILCFLEKMHAKKTPYTVHVDIVHVGSSFISIFIKGGS